MAIDGFKYAIVFMNCMRGLCAGAGTKGLGEFVGLSARGRHAKRRIRSTEAVKVRYERITDSV